MLNNILSEKMNEKAMKNFLYIHFDLVSNLILLKESDVKFPSSGSWISFVSTLENSWNFIISW